MKRELVYMIMGFAFLVFSFKASDKETKSVDAQNSSVKWKAYKVSGSHEGTLEISQASLEFENSLLIGGSFIIDMTTIDCTDLKGDGKSKLEGHLNSEDFFNTAKFPNAVLIIQSVEAEKEGMYTVKADMTIKDKTNEVIFPVKVDGNSATADLKVDRAKFDVRYGSESFFDGLKDKVIYDEFDLTVEVKF